MASSRQEADRGLTPDVELQMLRSVPVFVRCIAPSPAKISPAFVRRRAERMLRALELERSELSVLLCEEGTMRELNRLHRGVDRSTDVLSFGMQGRRGPQLANSILGDVVISLPDAARQAQARGDDPRSEVTMLLAHGVLHLLGFDHRNPSEERRMKARTDALIAAATATRHKPVVDRTRSAQPLRPARVEGRKRGKVHKLK